MHPTTTIPKLGRFETIKRRRTYANRGFRRRGKQILNSEKVVRMDANFHTDEREEQREG